MKAKKLAIICSFLALFLFGASITILADSIFSARSISNKFSASVVQASDGQILLSDNDEYRKTNINNTFVLNDINQTYKFAGEMNLFNVTDKEQYITIIYQNSEDILDPIAFDFNIQIKNLDTNQIIFEAPLSKLGMGDYTMVLPAETEYTLQFMVKTNREFSQNDTINSVDFNLLVQAGSI